MAADDRSAARLGPVGDRVIFENGSIRVWTLSVPPAETKRMHRHELPYLVVPLSGGRVEITTLEGVVRTPEDWRGTVLWQEAGPSAPKSGRRALRERTGRAEAARRGALRRIAILQHMLLK
jgi:hypothetical protein